MLMLPPPMCRRDWEAERARISSAEAEVARLLSEQQAEFAEREERMIALRWVAACHGGNVWLTLVVMQVAIWM